MSHLVGIPASMMADAWPVVAPLVVKACAGSNGRFTDVDVARAIAAREFQLWAAQADTGDISAIALTRLVKYPRLLAAEIMACVGHDMGEWVPHLGAIEEWAKAQGAAQVHAIVRHGWTRVLKPNGYEHTHSIVEKPL